MPCCKWIIRQRIRSLSCRVIRPPLEVCNHISMLFGSELNFQIQVSARPTTVIAMFKTVFILLFPCASGMRRATDFKSQGDALLNRGQWSDALEKYNIVLREEKRKGKQTGALAMSTYYKIGIAQFNLNEFLYAINSYDLVIQYPPSQRELAFSYQIRGQVRCNLNRRGDVNHIFQDLKKALTIRGSGFSEQEVQKIHEIRGISHTFRE